MTNANWFAVRCVLFFQWPDENGGGTYEERITLWRAESAEEAIGLAEADAQEYVADVSGEPGEWIYLGLAQSYHLFDEPGHGAEVFSLMRDSTLEPDAYLTTFFDAGTERQEHIAGEPE